MECPRGSIVRSSESVIQSLESARRWYELVNPDQLPIRVLKAVAGSGRMLVKVYDRDNNLIYRKG